MTTASRSDGVPHGWHTSARLAVARMFDDGSTLHVSRTRYLIEAADGTVLAAGDDHRPAPQSTWPAIIESLVAFLEHDAESYRSYLGPVPDHHDGYLFGEPGAAWAYQHADELAMSRLDAEEAMTSVIDTAAGIGGCEVCHITGPVALQQVGDHQDATFLLCASCGTPAVNRGMARWLPMTGT